MAATQTKQQPTDVLALIRQVDPAELDQRIREMDAELKTLTALRKVLRPRGGGQQTGPRTGPSIKSRVLEYLKTHGPSVAVPTIAKALDLPKSSVNSALTQNKKMFEKTATGWRAKP